MYILLYIEVIVPNNYTKTTDLALNILLLKDDEREFPFQQRVIFNCFTLLYFATNCTYNNSVIINIILLRDETIFEETNNLSCFRDVTK